MGYFTGTQATDIEDTVLDLLEGYLETKLAAAPYSTTFARWSGPGVTHNPDEDFGANARSSADAFSKKPWIYLEVVSQESKFWGTDVDGTFVEGARITMEISAEVLTSGACSPAEGPLKRALMQIVRAGYHDLWDLKLEESAIRAGQSTQDQQNRINPHTITVVVSTL